MELRGGWGVFRDARQAAHAHDAAMWVQGARDLNFPDDHEELDDDELDDIISALATDWQDLFGDEGENPFSGL